MENQKLYPRLVVSPYSQFGTGVIYTRDRMYKTHIPRLYAERCKPVLGLKDKARRQKGKILKMDPVSGKKVLHVRTIFVLAKLNLLHGDPDKRINKR